LAYEARDSAECIQVSLTSEGSRSTLKAKKAIVADGVNSRIAEALGMNQGRIFFLNALVLIYTMEGIRDFECTSFKFYMGLAYQSKAPILIGPTLQGAHVGYLLISGNRNNPPEKIYHNVITRGPLAYMFEQATLINKTGCGGRCFSSLTLPFRGNALIIGDAAAYVEVETQGALMCGFRAGKAVAKELTGEKGFEEYTQWWQKSFEFNGPEAFQVARGYALVPTYSDNELDYLFSLTEDEVLEGTGSQYKSPPLMWGSILRHREKIAREKPDLYEKIKMNQDITLKVLS
jgi:flavin-dependent dehydrogenase